MRPSATFIHVLRFANELPDGFPGHCDAGRGTPRSVAFRDPPSLHVPASWIAGRLPGLRVPSLDQHPRSGRTEPPAGRLPGPPVPFLDPQPPRERRRPHPPRIPAAAPDPSHSRTAEGQHHPVIAAFRRGLRREPRQTTEGPGECLRHSLQDPTSTASVSTLGHDVHSEPVTERDGARMIASSVASRFALATYERSSFKRRAGIRLSKLERGPGRAFSELAGPPVKRQCRICGPRTSDVSVRRGARRAPGRRM
jgi:hypothetical protein